MGLVLDSSIVIAAERRGDTVTQFLREIASVTGNDRAVLSAIGLTELVHAVYRAPELQTRFRREGFIRELQAGLEVLAYTQQTAMLAGRLDGEQRSKAYLFRYLICLSERLPSNMGVRWSPSISDISSLFRAYRSSRFS